MLINVLSILKRRLSSFLRIIIKYIYSQKAKSFKISKEVILNKVGLEIGGPSDIFSEKGLLPVYPHIRGLDNCNFSAKTVWDGKIECGYTFNYNENKTYGFQYVLDTTELNEIPSAKYDFILCSHVIEHIANPIKALLEWIRILKNDGVLMIIFPHKDVTFDHNREITSISHLIDDYTNNTGENDLTHLNEILELHDLENDPGVGSFNEFKERSLNNFENRCLHHHVFNTYLAARLIDYVKMQILSVEAIKPNNIIVIARKSGEVNNRKILNDVKENKFKSPFKSDKLISV